MREKKDNQKLIVVLGPTASGKSDLAIELAKKFKGEVIGADSRQIYKGLDIGSGKITKKEMRGVPHHLISIASPRKTFNVAQYKKRAENALKKIRAQNKIPILCGGTGFYIQAVVDNITFPNVLPNHYLRKKLSQQSTDELFSLLSELDQTYAQKIDRQNPRRLIRAIEIATEHGFVPPLPHQASEFKTLLIGIALPKKDHAHRIQSRLQKHLRHGMIAEVETLRKNGLSWKRLESLGLEYRFVAEYLQKKIAKQQMIEQLEHAIVQYAKRQMTWFKRDARIRWFRPHHYEKIFDCAAKFLVP